MISQLSTMMKSAMRSILEIGLDWSMCGLTKAHFSSALTDEFKMLPCHKRTCTIRHLNTEVEVAHPEFHLPGV